MRTYTEKNWKKLHVLEKKAIRLHKELIKTIDKIYAIDENAGEDILEFINDEKMMRN